MNLIFLTFVFPLIGFLVLSISRGKLSERLSGIIGVGSIGLSCCVALFVISNFNILNPEEKHATQFLWHWLDVKGFRVDLSLYLDGLSITMLSIILGIGFLIHLFSSWYMQGEIGYSRFFAYMNLFIASMLVLVLADNLLMLYLGWECVGLCSYLLIGFYYSNRNNGNAALKAFLVTRFGDVLMAIGLFILFHNLGTLNIQELLRRAPSHFHTGDFWIILAALMLLGGAIGKSAQIPLQTWLADAMAGPTPVSALIHAATMVTAGVYLIARTNGIFLLAPEVLYLISIIGAITLIIAGFAALVQTDIKRILAYSTMSQLGYMFLALGVGSWHGAIFHMVTHAFFKALLFLASGSVIIACHHEQNILKMGGLWKKLPIAYMSFIIGGCALSAMPLVTAGYYSKGEILWGVMNNGNWLLFYASLFGAFMTSLYTFRLIFITFHGDNKIKLSPSKHGMAYWIPLTILSILSSFVGAAAINIPVENIFPRNTVVVSNTLSYAGLEFISSFIAIMGILLAAFIYLGKRTIPLYFLKKRFGSLLHALWLSAWGFDWLYGKIFIRPYLALCQFLRKDPIDKVINLAPKIAISGSSSLSQTENGYIRWYIISMVCGAILIIVSTTLVICI